MCVSPRPEITSYWSGGGDDNIEGCPWISNRMGRDKWLEIHRSLHSELDIAWLLGKVSANFKSIIRAPLEVAIDETLALYKGRNPFRVVLKDKPGKVGSKIFTAGCLIKNHPVILGFHMNMRPVFKIYDVVADLISSFTSGDENRILYMDKFFTNSDTIKKIISLGQDVIGAISRGNHGVLFQHYLEDEARKKGHSAIFSKYKTGNQERIVSVNGLLFPKIKKKKSQVQAFVSTNLLGRFNTSDPNPNPRSLDVVHKYSENKGSIDTANQMMRYLEFPHKFCSFKGPIFMFLVNAAIVNSKAALFYLTGEKYTTRDFAKRLANELCPFKKHVHEPSAPHTLVKINTVRAEPPFTVACTHCRRTKKNKEGKPMSSKTSFACDSCYPTVYLHQHCFEDHHKICESGTKTQNKKNKIK